MLFAFSFVVFIFKQSVNISFHVSPEVGDQVIVEFPKWISENYAKKTFHITPSIDGELIWLENYHELHFLPYGGFKPSSEYHITVKFPISLLALFKNSAILRKGRL